MSLPLRLTSLEVRGTSGDESVLSNYTPPPAARTRRRESRKRQQNSPGGRAARAQSCRNPGSPDFFSSPSSGRHHSPSSFSRRGSVTELRAASCEPWCLSLLRRLFATQQARLRHADGATDREKGELLSVMRQSRPQRVTRGTRRAVGRSRFPPALVLLVES